MKRRILARMLASEMAQAVRRRFAGHGLLKAAAVEGLAGGGLYLEHRRIKRLETTNPSRARLEKRLAGGALLGLNVAMTIPGIRAGYKIGAAMKQAKYAARG